MSFLYILSIFVMLTRIAGVRQHFLIFLHHPSYIFRKFTALKNLKFL
jgi:hypothetical protein